LTAAIVACRLARELHKAQPVELKVAGRAERMHVEALATVASEMLVLEVLAVIAAHCCGGLIRCGGSTRTIATSTRHRRPSPLALAGRDPVSSGDCRAGRLLIV
jgi:hypothetical protein